jgi:predicted amidohydrolase
MRVAVCQMSSNADKAHNLSVALQLLEEAARQRTQVAVLPEYLDYIGPDAGAMLSAEELGGPLSSALAAKAKELALWVVGGTIRVRDGNDRIANTLIVYNPDGQRQAIYRKLHLFDLSIPGEIEFLESRTVRAGNDVVTTDIAGTRAGLSICYDLRFPELFRLQALAGARILFVPSAFTAFTGRDHWETLLRARAIENQCFVVAAGQYGTPMPGMGLYGRSMIIDPWGTVLACAPDGVNVVTAELDLEAVDRVRRKVPALQNRRSDIYTLSINEAEQRGLPTLSREQSHGR